MKNNRSKLIPIIVLLIALIGLVLIPLKILGYGFLPEDDALRHAAKAISGKAWDEILVVRSEGIIDTHPGWHAILSFIYRTMKVNADFLVVFSVLVLFLIFCLFPLFLVNRPESWVGTLLVIAILNFSFIMRLLLGRPYIFTMAVMLVIGFRWPSLKEERFPYKTFVAILLMTAISTWVHGSWYLFLLPIVAFFLAREWRVAKILTYSIICGIILGALLTFHPLAFLSHGLSTMMLAFGTSQVQRVLVMEFQPFAGDPMVIFAIICMMGWHYINGRWNKKMIDNPIFILIVLGWMLGFVVKRFWLDWGMVAFAIWMSFGFQDVFKKTMKTFSWNRFFLTFAIVVSLYLAVTCDLGGRWTMNLTKEYLSTENPEQAAWLPQPGGIIYSDDMSIFYDTFFKNPNAKWRYILGFEPAFMPPDELAILRRIQWNYGAYQAFEPWVKKMNPADRLILRRPYNEKPNIPGLEWRYAASGIWIGRLSRS